MLLSKKIFLGASGIFLFLFLMLPVSFFINLKYVEKVSAQEDSSATNCYLINEGFNMIIGGYNLPVFTENTKSNFFSGYPVYRYFFPSCPVLNKSDRPSLYNFDRSGALKIADNLVIGGDRTFLLTEGNVGFSRYKSDNLGEEWSSVSTYLNMVKETMSVFLSANAILPEAWNI
ncbi:hypothetical protein K8R62_03965, partial [bacterium]|nr:hypothetical protein [bacterium]